MIERPILMNAFSVRAILARRKTQTRRVIKPQPAGTFAGLASVQAGFHKYEPRYSWHVDKELSAWRKCPYGQIGNRLWVREIFGIHNEGDGTNFYVYRADYDPDEPGPPPSYHWTPSIFMPRVASRILLEITEVRVEQLQDITGNDCLEEGLKQYTQDGVYKNVLDLREEYWDIWDSINAKRGFSRKRNPWVWVIGFKPLTDTAIAKV